MSILEQLQESTIKGDHTAVESLVKQALENKEDIENIIQNGFIPAMGIVGEKFKSHEIFVPEMLMAARAMQRGLKILEPYIVSGQRKFLTKIVLGTVKGDLHDIGKNLVGMMLEGSGVEVIDLGIDVPPEKFVEAVKEHRPAFVGLSALLTTTMSNIPVTIKALEEAGLRDQVKVIIGGAPINEEFAKEAGADGYAPDASRAVDLIKKLM